MTLCCCCCCLFVCLFVVLGGGAKGCHSEKDVHMREESFNEDTYLNKKVSCIESLRCQVQYSVEVIKSPDKEFYY